MTDASEFPEGTVILASAQPADGVDVDVALDLARRGASLMVVRAVGGDDAVQKAKAIAKRARGRQ